MNIRDLFLAKFHWASKPLSNIFRGLEADLDAASWKIHPEVYFSIVIALASIVFVIPIFFLLILYGVSYLEGYTIFPLNLILFNPQIQIYTIILKLSTMVM